LAQCYEYTVSVDLSTASSTVSIDNSSKSAAVKVLHKLQYLSQLPVEPVEFPAQSDLRFWFDFSNPACFDGVSSSFNDLSGNGNNGQIIDYATDSPVSSVEDLVKSDKQGSSIHLPFLGGKFMRWGASSELPSSFTAVIVARSADVVETVLDADPQDFDDDFDLKTPQTESSAAEMSTRGDGNKGFRVATHRETNYYYRGEFEINYPPTGERQPEAIGVQTIYQRCTTFGVKDIDTKALSFYNSIEGFFAQDRLEPFLNGHVFISDAIRSVMYPDGQRNYGVVNEQFNDAHVGFGQNDVQIISFSIDEDKVSNFLNGQEISNQNTSSDRKNSGTNTWFAGVSPDDNGNFSENNIRGGTFYAMAFFEKALSAEEHRQVYDYYNKATVRPSLPYMLALPPSVQLSSLYSGGANIYSGINYGEFDGGRQKADILIDPSLASVAQDISIDVSAKTSSVSIDNSSHTSEVLVCPLPIRAPRLDLDAKYWVDGSDTWYDASISEAHFAVEGSPTKTADGFITVNSSNRFVRTVVTAPDPLTTNIEDYVRDPFIPYDSSFTFEFVFRFNTAVTQSGLRYKLWGYSGYWTESKGGGFNYGTGNSGTLTPLSLFKPQGLKVDVYAGNNKGRGIPPYSNRIGFSNSLDTGDPSFDLGIGDDLIADGTVFYVQFVYDVENNRARHYVNGVLIDEDNQTLGVGLAGINQLFSIGRSTQGGWTSSPGFDIKTLKIYDYAMNSNDISRRYTELQE
jgi:hypothetical protein